MSFTQKQSQTQTQKHIECNKIVVVKKLSNEQKKIRLANIKKIRNTPLFKINKPISIDNDVTPTNSCKSIDKTPFIIQMDMV